MISFACTHCQSPLKVEPKGDDQRVKCPRCAKIVRVPRGTTSIPTSPHPTPTREDPGNPDGANVEPTFIDADEAAEFTSFLSPSRGGDELGWLGPYRVLKVLGHGGMGVVFHAEDSQLGRSVAIKAILPRYAKNPNARQRFLREARAAAALKHDNIVSIYQVGEDCGTPYLAMEFLEGQSLDQYMKRKKQLPANELLRIGRDIAAGLAEAHARDLIHRDIKPGNIWLERKKDTPAGTSIIRVKILDFGLARDVKEDTSITRSGAILGSPAYMAPEQAKGESVDHRVDLFSLGCVLYRLATGQLPFRGPNTLAILSALATETPEPPATINPDIPPTVSDFILKLLEKNPNMRPASARETSETLHRLLRELKSAPVASPPPTVASTPDAAPPNVNSRRRWLIWLASVSAVLLVVAVIWGINRRNRDVVPVDPKSIETDADGSATQERPAPDSLLGRLQRTEISADDLTWAFGPNASKSPRELVGVFRNHSIVTASDSRLGGFALSADGRWLALGGPGFQVEVYDLATGTSRLGSRSSHSIAYFFLLGKSTLVTGSTSGSLTSRNLLTHQETIVANAPAGVAASTFAAGLEGNLFLLGATDGRILVVNPLTWRMNELPTSLTEPVVDILFRADRGRFAAADGSGNVLTWATPNVRSLFASKSFPRPPERLSKDLFPKSIGKLRQIEFGPEESQLFAAFSASPDLHVYNLDRRTSLPSVPVGEGVTSFAFAPDGALIATIHSSGSLRLWNVAQQKQERDIALPAISDNTYGPVQFAPDGRHVLVGHPRGAVLVLRLP